LFVFFVYKIIIEIVMIETITIANVIHISFLFRKCSHLGLYILFIIY
jgi:hypothetical protein